jgi:16S rRNA U1498 N3-methylase RsmE
MTRDDIIRMAKEAGFNQILATNTGADVWIDDGFYVEEMERFAAIVAEAQMEQTKEWIATWVEDWCDGWSAKKIAHGIRGDGNDAVRPNKYVTQEEPL